VGIASRTKATSVRLQAMVLEPNEVIAQLASRQPWRLEDGMLTLSLQPESFDEVCRIVKSIMQIAIDIDHHPDVCFGYRSLLVRTITHDEGGITSKDFDCADRILKLIA
jgi:4a-hydroxytetrahydrobiopterin dehydratase